MPQQELRLAAIVQTVADELLLAEALLFPEASCCGLRPGKVREQLQRRVRRIVKELPPGGIWQRRLAELPALKQINVSIPSARDDLGRREAVTLTFHYVQWRHASDAVIAYLPALQIEVLAEDERQLADLLQPQIAAALARRGASTSLADLVWLDRHCGLRVKELQLTVKLPTLKQAAQQERAQAEQQKSVLKEIATDLGRQPYRSVYERGELLARLAQLLAARSPQSVLLVGASGVGKTALVRELARRRGELPLGRTPLWSTSGSRLIAGMSGFGMWQQRCQRLIHEASRTRAIVHLDNLVELIEVGKGGGNSQGIAAVLRPALARGSLLAIAECTPEQLAFVERDDPQLLAAFTQLEVPATTSDQTRSILRQVVAEQVGEDAPALLPESLATLDRLHRRYATYSAAPGRQLRFLRNLLEDQPRRSAIGPAAIAAAFSNETGLPLFMLDDAQPLDLDAARDWFEKRVVGQPEPVNVVVELLAAVKAGLARGGKPLASLLFIGPTGVGKTELAKALAEFLYRDSGRMVRLDMSEYATAEASLRLIGGADAPGLLTQRVRDQPFMVVLLDEFEKAHPALFDVLLQVLGEGRLTDAAGRVADFTNAVIIMTSNLGAETFRSTAAGFGGMAALENTAERHFEREVRSLLRPELFNRLDRIVSFAPLSRAAIAGIAGREIERVLGRDGLRLRGVSVEVEPAAIEHLTAVGFDPRYGARPLKRTIERALVAPLAEQLGRYSSDVPLACQARARDGGLLVEAAAVAGGSGRTAAGTDRLTLAALDDLVKLRRQMQALVRSSVVLRLRNEIARLRQVERERRRKLKRRGKQPKFVFSAAQAQILSQEGLLQRIDALAGRVQQQEDDALGSLYADQPVDRSDISAASELLSLELRELLFELHRSADESRGELVLAIYGESLGRVLELAQAYERIGAGQSSMLNRYWLKMHNAQLMSRGTPAEESELRLVMRLKSRKVREEDKSRKVVDVYCPPPQQFRAPPSDVIGVALAVKDQRTAALLESEGGLHEFARMQGRPEICAVETHAGLLVKYDPPANVGRSGVFADLAPRRTYHHDRELCHDHRLNVEVRLRGRSIDESVTQLTADYLAQRIWRLLD